MLQDHKELTVFSVCLEHYSDYSQVLLCHVEEVAILVF